MVAFSMKSMVLTEALVEKYTILISDNSIAEIVTPYDDIDWRHLAITWINLTYDQ